MQFFTCFIASIMKSFGLLTAVLAFRLTFAYLVNPPDTAAPGATSNCSGWVQQSYDLTCELIEKLYGITEVQLASWVSRSRSLLLARCNTTAISDFQQNPSVTLLGDGCNLISGLFYCVEINFVTMSLPPASPPTPTTSQSAATTLSENGITTPTPTQTGMVKNCNKFYLVASEDSCFDIAASNHIALNDFYAWNTAVKTACTGLFAGYYVCVGTQGSTPSRSSTPPERSSAIATPAPYQSGMTTGCRGFHLVVSGDTCSKIAATAGISLTNFYSWNPAVGTGCTALWTSYYVCIAIR